MAWYDSLSDLAGDVGSVAKNPLVDAGLGVLTGGAALPLLAGTAGKLLSPGQPQPGAQQGGSAIPMSAFNTSGGTMGANAGAPAEQNQGSSGILGSLSGLAGQAGNFLTGNNGANALGTVGAISAYLNQNKANDLAKQALGSVEQSYNERAPLRAQGLASLANSQAGNPFTRGS